MRTNQCTIANKEVGVATHLTQLLNLTGSAKDGNITNTKTGLFLWNASNTIPALMPNQSNNLKSTREVK